MNRGWDREVKVIGFSEKGNDRNDSTTTKLEGNHI